MAAALLSYEAGLAQTPHGGLWHDARACIHLGHHFCHPTTHYLLQTQALLQITTAVSHTVWI
eukprot:10362685-Prorocentrum_lima.AAC.1